MSRVPLPERGQPLDLAYIYQLANTINNLADQLSPSVAKYTTIETVGLNKQSIRTSDARIVGGFVTVNNASSTSPGSETAFSYNFSDFQFVPIVTVTPILINEANTDAGKDVSVVLTTITPNRVEGIVIFNSIGIADIGLNILAVGIPV
jgi:hypothetical protein